MIAFREDLRTEKHWPLVIEELQHCKVAVPEGANWHHEVTLLSSPEDKEEELYLGMESVSLLIRS
jgi:hypothetical protein